MKMPINKDVLSPNGSLYKKQVAKEQAIKEAQKVVKATKKKAKPKTLTGRLNAGSFEEGEILERNGYGGKTLRYATRFTIIKHLNDRFQHRFSVEIRTIEAKQPIGFSAVVRLTIDHPKLKRIIEEVGETDSSSEKAAVSDALKRCASYVLPYYNELWREDV